jgi:GNAT superfamily N-acetyltransferase
MKMLSYRELANKDDIFILWLKSFYWAGTPNWLDNYMKYDEWLIESPIGMCGLIGKKLVGFVGMMVIPTRTRHGDIEKVGGIYGIAVRPSYSRQGIGRKLMFAAEDYFRERGIRYSFLTTARFLTAYNWYIQDGYRDIPAVEKYPYMYKIFKKPNKNPIMRTTKEYKFNHKEMLALFEHYAKTHCGFTVRTPRHLKTREIENVYSKKLSILTDKGYALLANNTDSIIIKEIYATNQKTYSHLIKMAEQRAKYAVAAQHPFDSGAIKALKKAGYTIDQGNYITAMYKELGKDKFSNAYDKNFMISKVDWF